MLLTLLALSLPLTPPAFAAANPCARAAAKNPLVHDISFGFDDPKLVSALGLTQEERVDIACQVRSAILARYSAINLKRDRIKLDPEAHLNDCVNAEFKAPDDSRLNFGARMKKCVAGFQDTHMHADLHMPPPAILTGVTLGWMQNKVVIADQHKNVLSWIEQKDNIKNLPDLLPVGAEVVEIDGVATEEWLLNLLPYESGSTELFRRQKAADDLLWRDFLYPKRNFVDLKVKLDSGAENLVRLPYYSSSAVMNMADANAELKRVGIPSFENLKFNYNKEKNTWVAVGLQTVAKTLDEPLVAGVTEFKGEGDDVAARFGEVLLDRTHSFCYLQVLTFNSESLISPSGEKSDWKDTIRELVADCESKELPLMLDLRSNGGGNEDYATILMAALTKKGEKSSGVLNSLRASKFTVQQFSQMEESNSTGAWTPAQEGELEKKGRKLVEAYKSGAAQMDIYVSPDIEPSLEDGFNQPVVALVTPNCISTCDIMASLLKINKRATLIGTQSNGTGAGMVSIEKLNSNFQDTYKVLDIVIPSTLFGVAPKTGMGDFLPFEANKGLISENQPTVADIQYEPTPQDLVDGYRGWYKLALSTLMNL